MNKIQKSFNQWSSLNEGVNAKNTISFSGGSMGLYHNNMVNHLGGHDQQIKDGRDENAEVWGIVGFNEVILNGTPYVLVSGFSGKGGAAEEGRELLLMSTDKNEVQRRFKSGVGSEYASTAWGMIEWSKLTDSSISINPIDIDIKTI